MLNEIWKLLQTAIEQIQNSYSESIVPNESFTNYLTRVDKDGHSYTVEVETQIAEKITPINTLMKSSLFKFNILDVLKKESNNLQYSSDATSDQKQALQAYYLDKTIEE
jgi:hypothetical protein